MDNKNETNDQGLICAFDLDGKGGGQELNWLEVNEPQQSNVVRWIHLDHSARDSRSWLATENFGCCGIRKGTKCPNFKNLLLQICLSDSNIIW